MLRLKLRTLPFGYQCCDGVTAAEPQESQILRQICASYLSGKSLLDIAGWLNDAQIPYLPGVVGWNKARLKRMLEDRRYLGDDRFPSLLTRETFDAIQRIREQRNTQKGTDRHSGIFCLTVPIHCPTCGTRMARRNDTRCRIPQRWVCGGCGHRVEIADSELLERLDSLLRQPIRVQAPVQHEPSAESRALDREVERMMVESQIDRAALRENILTCLCRKYAALDEESQLTRRLQGELDRAAKGDRDSVETLNRTASRVLLHADRAVEIVLRNGQRVGKEDAYGTSD